MYKDKILNIIHETSQIVAPDEFTRLRIKEELLCMVVKHNCYSLATKKEAMEAIKRINKKQLEVMGHLTKDAK